MHAAAVWLFDTRLGGNTQGHNGHGVARIRDALSLMRLGFAGAYSAAGGRLQQKRAFVRGWHTDTRQLLGGNGGSAPTPGRFVGDGAADAATLFSELDARLKRQQRSVTQTELPDAVLSHYATSVAAIVGTPLPTSQHERRELVYRWYEHYGRG